MPGLRQHNAEALVLNGLRTQLMQPAAYEKFRADFSRHVQAQARELSADQKFREAELRELEVQQGHLVGAVAHQGQALNTLLPALEEVERRDETVLRVAGGIAPFGQGGVVLGLLQVEFRDASTFGLPVPVHPLGLQCRKSYGRNWVMGAERAAYRGG